MNGTLEIALSRSRRKTLTKRKYIMNAILASAFIYLFSILPGESLIEKYITLGEKGREVSVVSLEYVHNLPSSVVIRGGFLAQEALHGDNYGEGAGEAYSGMAAVYSAGISFPAKLGKIFFEDLINLKD